ncbi:MAG: hypothetical protein U1F57_01335 [bacterium]
MAADPFKKSFSFQNFAFHLALLLFWGGFACTGSGGGGAVVPGPAGGVSVPVASSGSNAAPTATITPRGDDLPMTACSQYDPKSGTWKWMIPCPASAVESEEAQRYDPSLWVRTRLSHISDLDSARAEEMGRDPKKPTHLKVADGDLYFRLEVPDKNTDGSVSWISPPIGIQVRAVVLPADGAKEYRYADATVGLIQIPGGYNFSLKNLKLKPGDTVEFYQYDKSDYSQADGRWSYEKTSDYSETGGMMAEETFRSFYVDANTFFLGSFQTPQEYKKMEGRPSVDLPSALETVVPGK